VNEIIAWTVRTVAGLIYTAAVYAGINTLGLPDEVVTLACSVIAGGLLLLLIHLLELIEPKFGILLGKIGAPQYAGPIDAKVTEAGSYVVTALKDEIGQLKDEIVGDLTPHLEATAQAADTAAVTAKATQASVTEVHAAVVPAPAADPVPPAAAPAKKTTPRKRAAAKKTAAAAAK
jgi:hypothetical protein